MLPVVLSIVFLVHSPRSLPRCSTVLPRLYKKDEEIKKIDVGDTNIESVENNEIETTTIEMIETIENEVVEEEKPKKKKKKSE